MGKNKTPLPRLLLRGAALALCLLCLCGAFGAAAQLDRLYPGVGLRFSAAAPVTGAQLKALEKARAQGGKPGVAPLYATFWRQEQAAAASPGAARTATALTALTFYGNAAYCYAGEYLTGTAPGSGDTASCAVSAALARKLYGSTDAVGLTLALTPEQTAEKPGGGKARILRITGVFAGDTALLLRPGGIDEGYPCATLQNAAWDDPHGQAQSFVQSNGLPAPETYLYGPQLAWLARGLCLLPLALAGVRLLLAGWRAARRWPRLRRQLLWFLLALAAAAALPLALAALPGWLIPNRWSDFAYWASFFRAASDRLGELFALTPLCPDILAKQTAGRLLLWLGGALAALWAGARCPAPK